MDTKILSRSYLETLSSADLISLADDYGIDVPDDLNRRFIIGELLELADELQQEKSDAIAIVAENPESLSGVAFPERYNETQISVLLRSPAWAFVYWDMREAEREQFASGVFSALGLRISFFLDEDAVTRDDSFDIQISLEDKAQYVLLKSGKRFVRISLVASLSDGGEETLAVSRMVTIPVGSELLTTALPGRDIALSPLQELSSLKELLRNHYENHRQALLV